MWKNFSSFKKAFLVLLFWVFVSEMAICYNLEIFGGIGAVCSVENLETQGLMAFYKQTRKFQRVANTT